MRKRILSYVLILALLIAFIPAIIPNALSADVKDLELVNYISTYPVRTVVASPKSDMLLIQESSSWNVYLYDIKSGVKKTLVDTLPVGVGVSGMCFNLDGSLCAVSSREVPEASMNEAVIKVFSTKSGEIINEITLGAARGYIAFDRGNNLISYDTVSGRYGYDSTRGITVRDIHTGDMLLGIENDGAYLFAQNPASDVFAAAIYGGMIMIYNGQTGGGTKVLELNSSVGNMVYSPNGKYFVASCDYKTIIYDVDNNYSAIREVANVGRVSFNDNGDVLVIGNTVYFADDGFSDYTTITDKENQIYTETALITQAGKLFTSCGYGTNGIRLLDASKISIRLKEIRLEPEELEISIGKETELKLIGIYSDGSTQELNLQKVTFSISDFTVARITDNLKIQGLGAGECVLKVGYLGGEIQKSVTVVPRKPIDTAADWARDGINSALDKGFIPEDLQDNYSDVITRQEFCRMAVKWVEYASGKNVDTILAENGLSRDPNAFTDTNDPYILAAYALGITSGTGDGKFTPDGQFTREQAATMLRNVCRAIGMNVMTTTNEVFADVADISDWAQDSVGFCRANGIMSGTGNNSFSPKGVYTRQESIVTLDRVD